MIRIDAIWLAAKSVDMRAGTVTALVLDLVVRCGEAALSLSTRQSPRPPPRMKVLSKRSINPTELNMAGALS
ncbi:hypothetical protein [Pseudomonas syringae]|uniref:hypothetical protein n=1 Tax=Pseudomonas syringae TaxID=317 RepID=UPI00177EEDD4|nr:hypothetical protein [Pseudomonas syringae]